MTLKKIAEKAWAYTLYDLSGQYVLGVLCGGAAMYELNIPLDHDEGIRAVNDSAYLEALASEIRSNPNEFAHRAIKM